MTTKSDKVKFADLDTFLKIAPILALALLAYLQTLFPSKLEFDKVHDKLIQMDKKITEMAVLQKAITSNTLEVHGIRDRLRLVEIQIAKGPNRKNSGG